MSEGQSRQKLLLCNCQKTMSIDGELVGRALGCDGAPSVHRELCRTEIEVFRAALAGDDAVHVACTQEAPLFQEVADEFFEQSDDAQGEAAGGSGSSLHFTNIRERAGWCSDEGAAGNNNISAKIAALLAESRYESKPAPSMTLSSDGQCLVYGAGQAAIDVAGKLSRSLSVTLMLTAADDIIPPGRIDVPINRGRIKTASGHLGAFEVIIDGYAPMLPSSRSGLEFAMARDGAASDCDLIFDMSGDTSLFSSPQHVDGYFRIDPKHPAAIAEAMFEIIDMVGEFEKPRYVSYDAGICAHSRNGLIGCSNCIDNCPAGAITPNEDAVRIDPAICGGCGNCSAVCPTGAVSYQYPIRQDVIARAQLLLQTYGEAGGSAPGILVHDAAHGGQMIAAMARYGKGLPASLLPLSIYSVFQLGHETMAAMLASGAQHIALLVPPGKEDDLPALEREADLTNVLTGALGYAGERIHILRASDPDVIEAALHGLHRHEDMIIDGRIEPVGSKRDIARNALAKLHAAAPKSVDVVDLPAAAPYGRISIETDGCTLCLSCVSACPAGALDDHADHPEVSITEAACVQCGICVVTCPENVITLVPRYNFLTDALTADVLNQEEPFLCISCSKPFGTKSTIEKVVGRLEGHSMFQNEEQLKLIQMCDNCRVVAMAERNDDPFNAGARPKTRTTEDYLAAEAAAEASGKKPEEFLD